MDSLIVKQLHPHLHIPAAFCILKSSRAELHCKIEGCFFREVPVKTQTLSLHKKNGVALILLTEKSNVEALSNSKEVSDIWITPMSDAEVRFRFLKWQHIWKSSKDFWLTRQYLETVINGVPNLIWYKTKDGIHVKENDSFCAASGKTREQVEGQDHFYAWDVDPNDPETDGNSCMESERITMGRRDLCNRGNCQDWSRNEDIYNL